MAKLKDTSAIVLFIKEALMPVELERLDVQPISGSSNLLKKSIAIDAVGEATYKYILGKMVYESLPTEIKAKVDAQVAITQFIIVAGTIGAKMISYQTMMDKVADVKANYDAGQPVVSIADESTVLDDSATSEILGVVGFIKSVIEETKSALFKEDIQTDPVVAGEKDIKDIITTKVPDVIVDIVNKKDFSNFTNELMKMIKVDIRKDIDAQAKIKDDETALTTSLGSDPEDSKIDVSKPTPAAADGGDASLDIGLDGATEGEEEVTDPTTLSDDDVDNLTKSNIEGEDADPAVDEEPDDKDSDKDKEDLIKEAMSKVIKPNKFMMFNNNKAIHKKNGTFYIESILQSIKKATNARTGPIEKQLNTLTTLIGESPYVGINKS